MPSIRKFDLNLDEAKNICQKYSLEMPLEVTRLEEGMINDVFSLDKKYVVKANTGHPNLAKLKKESEVYKLLAQNNIAVPHVYGYDDSKELIKYSYIIMEHINGVSLGSIWNTLSKEQKLNWLPKIGRLLAQIHDIHFAEFGDEFSNGQFVGTKNYRKYIDQYVKNIAKELEKSKVLDKKKIEQLENYFEKSNLFDININASLIHFNFIFDNIIVDGDDIKAIVDWEWARSGHNEQELAMFIYRTLKQNIDFTKAFRKGYEEIMKIDDNFENRLYAYNLLYFLKVFPDVSKWVHRPDKQKEYTQEVEKLFKEVI